MSPTFDGNQLFSSKDSNGNTFDEGVCSVDGYTGQIREDIHFEGETGDWSLFHGVPNQKWKYVGMLSAPTASELGTLISNISQAEQQNTGDQSTYYELIDSFGFSYSYAQICRWYFTSFPHVTDSGWVCGIVVEGIIQGNGSGSGGGSD